LYLPGIQLSCGKHSASAASSHAFSHSLDLLQPVALIWDSLVHSPPQLRLDFLELRLHAVAPGLPLKLEESSA
jgi:hypothetical protein